LRQTTRGAAGSGQRLATAAEQQQREPTQQHPFQERIFDMSKRRSNTKEQEQSPKSPERRSVLIGAGKVAAVGAVVSALGSTASAEVQSPPSKGMKCMTVLYKNGDGIHFDFDYYKNHHMKMILEQHGKSIHRFELRKAIAAADGSKPLYIATLTIWIADEPAFIAADAKYGRDMLADVHNFTNTTPVIQKDELFAAKNA
jgi:uncharacterized protein (TIGR02118 family)